MRRHRHIPAMAVWAAVALTAAAADFDLKPAEGPQLESILASVNGEAISLGDILPETRLGEWKIYASYSGSASGEAVAGLRKQVVDEIIDRKLIQADYRSKPFTIPEQYVESLLDDLAEEAGCRTRAEFEGKLRAAGITPEEMRRKALDRLIVQAMVSNNSMVSSYVSPKQVYEYFQQHRAEFDVPPRLQLALIRIGRERENREALVKQAAARLSVAPREFSAVAAELSDGPAAGEGGALGWIDRPGLRREFAAALGENPVAGKVCGPLELEDGTYFLLPSAFTAGRKAEFAAVREEIRKRLETQARKAAYDAYVGKLRERALIRYYF